MVVYPTVIWVCQITQMHECRGHGWENKKLKDRGQGWKGMDRMSKKLSIGLVITLTFSLIKICRNRGQRVATWKLGIGMLQVSPRLSGGPIGEYQHGMICNLR